MSDLQVAREQKEVPNWLRNMLGIEPLKGRPFALDADVQRQLDIIASSRVHGVNAETAVHEPLSLTDITAIVKRVRVSITISCLPSRKDAMSRTRRRWLRFGRATSRATKLCSGSCPLGRRLVFVSSCVRAHMRWRY